MPPCACYNQKLRFLFKNGLINVGIVVLASFHSLLLFTTNKTEGKEWKLEVFIFKIYENDKRYRIGFSVCQQYWKGWQKDGKPFSYAQRESLRGGKTALCSCHWIYRKLCTSTTLVDTDSLYCIYVRIDGSQEQNISCFFNWRSNRIIKTLS